MSSKIYIDDAIDIKATFKNKAGALADPTDVSFRVEDPEGTITVYEASDPEIDDVSTGIFILTVTVDKQGPWRIAGIGEGAVQKSGVVRVDVELRPGD